MPELLAAWTTFPLCDILSDKVKFILRENK